MVILLGGWCIYTRYLAICHHIEKGLIAVWFISSNVHLLFHIKCQVNGIPMLFILIFLWVVLFFFYLQFVYLPSFIYSVILSFVQYFLASVDSFMHSFSASSVYFYLYYYITIISYWSFCLFVNCYLHIAVSYHSKISLVSNDISVHLLPSVSISLGFLSVYLSHYDSSHFVNLSVLLGSFQPNSLLIYQYIK